MTIDELAREGAAKDDFDTLSLDNQLCFALYATTHAMSRAYRPLLAQLGLTYPQYLVMIVLWEGDARTVSQLGRALHLDSGTLTPLLKRLEAMGLVTRTRRTSDEREVEVRLTLSGHELREEAIAVRSDIVCQLGMSEEEIARLRAEIIGVLKALDGAPSHQTD